MSRYMRGIMATLLWLGSGLAAHAQTTVEYIHTDALGTPIAVTDANKVVIETTEYEPYGAQVAGPVKDGPGYTGHAQDVATGLTYMQQRYYDPQSGVFLSVDPVTATSDPIGQFHRYRYASNNPYRFIDPDGRQSADHDSRSICNTRKCDAVIDAGTSTGGAKFSLRRYKGEASQRKLMADVGVDVELYDEMRDNHEDFAFTVITFAAGGGLIRTGAKEGPVVIGETMLRVESAAAKIPGSRILNDMPDFKAMGMNEHQVTSAMMRYNRKWILEQLRSGREIIDLGKDAARKVPSIFYQMEQNMIRNYKKIHEDFNRVKGP
jgi:RHS repeat-associated protein